jgi:NADPH:quinone reductase-like Zn-dependent oxidoreductase
MRAVVLTEYGDVDKLEVREVTEPKPGDKQVKVRVAGASVNPIDWKLRSGAARARMPLDLPAILGRDVSGLVVEVGAQVTEFKEGDRVLGLVNHGYAEFVVADVGAWAHAPEGLDLVDAAALPLVLLTGAQLIEEAIKPAKGDRLLVTGALGSVGRVAVFVAREHGARVYAGVRAAQRAEASKLGAEGVIGLDDPEDVARLPELDSIADTIGGDGVQHLLARLKRGGVLGSVVGKPAGAEERGLVVRPIFTHPDSKRLAELARAVTDETLIVPIARRFPLTEVREGQKLAEGGGAGGKVLLLP